MVAGSTLVSAQLELAGGEVGLPLPPPPPPLVPEGEGTDFADWVGTPIWVEPWEEFLVWGEWPSSEVEESLEWPSSGWAEESWEELVLDDEIDGSEKLHAASLEEEEEFATLDERCGSFVGNVTALTMAESTSFPSSPPPPLPPPPPPGVPLPAEDKGGVASLALLEC